MVNPALPVTDGGHHQFRPRIPATSTIHLSLGGKPVSSTGKGLTSTCTLYKWHQFINITCHLRACEYFHPVWANFAGSTPE